MYIMLAKKMAVQELGEKKYGVANSKYSTNGAI